MPLVRIIVSYRDSVSTPIKDAMSNTLYFNVTTDPFDPVGYQALVDDLFAAYNSRTWAQGRYFDIRAYDMGDAEPRPQKARHIGAISGTRIDAPHQLCLCLSYYADRNLEGFRGRIFCGPFNPAATSGQFATAAQQADVLALATSYANLGGVNVDWSLYSPTKGTHTRINHAWVDNSWDIIRSRKLAGTNRVTWSGDG
jgi:hypothetical protein